MKVATRDALTTWLDRLAQNQRLIAPRDADGTLLYAPVTHAAEIVFDGTRPKMSAKSALFPATHTLLSIDKRGEQVTLSEPAADPQVVFGLRPCDARGISVLDAVFIQREPVDTNYARRREATTLVGLACTAMGPTCFCSSMGGAPDDARHLDVLMSQVDGGYAVNAVTAKGQALIQELELRDSAATPTPPALNSTEPPVNKARLRDRFRDRYWDLLAERCLGCRVCSYVCPTCRCFDVRDEAVERRTNRTVYDRVRGWDACTGANYRVVAGGANPRKTPGTRLRNRFFCKLDYMAEDYGVDGCVGCGRCVESCPVNIDIVEVMREFSHAEGGA